MAKKSESKKDKQPCAACNATGHGKTGDGMSSCETCNGAGEV